MYINIHWKSHGTLFVDCIKYLCRYSEIKEDTIKRSGRKNLLYLEHLRIFSNHIGWELFKFNY